MHCSRLPMIAVLAVILVCAAADSLDAQFKNPFRRKANTERTSRELKMNDGPWVIMCTSFSGENAEQNARILAKELSSYRLKTYIYRQSFDYTDAMPGLGWKRPKMIEEVSELNDEFLDPEDTLPEPIKMKSANLSVVNEVAVLVGDFSSADDYRAQKALKKIKSIQLQNSIGHLSKQIDPEKVKALNLALTDGGPLRTAFLLPNPLLPEEYFQRRKVDDFVVKLNKKVKHSLLKCPGTYSVRIASFRGDTTIDPQKIRKNQTELQSLQRNGELLTSSRLVKAAENAHIITETLRKKGIEAYEFHDRSESIVCIGSFDWVTRETKDRAINNPDIVKLVNRLRVEKKNLPGAPGAIIPRLIQGIPLDPEPTPILVPKLPEGKTAGRLRNLIR